MNSENNSKRFFIHTLGCKVNQYESQVMREALLKAGYGECLSKDMADVYILNTCTVTHHADRESRRWIGLFHKSNPRAKIVVTGCYVEGDSDKVSFMPGCVVLKNADKHRIAEFLGGEKADSAGSITAFEGRTKAFVKIQDGCENRCSYCKVPLVRSAVRSKPVKDITDEVRALAAAGYKEIVLVGICLGAWEGLKGATLVDALKAIDRIEGEFRVRLSSIEPAYVTDELVEYMSRNRRICRHLHIPLQSGDDDVLKMMNRPYTAAQYRSLTENIRHNIEDVAITTDLLVGFPGETEERFQNTLDFMKEIKFSRSHIFTFSRRRGTAAYDMAGAVDSETARKRYLKLWVAALMTSYDYKSRFLGKRLDVLVESKKDRNSGTLTGYSDNYIKVIFDGPDEIMKKIAPVRIKNIMFMHTIGECDGM